jgi:hypothetical protein
MLESFDFNLSWAWASFSCWVQEPVWSHVSHVESFSHFSSAIHVPPSMGAPSPTTKAPSSFSVTVKTGSKHSSDKEIQGFSGFACHIVNHINSPVSQQIDTETVNPAANDFIHPFGGQLIQSLLEIKCLHRPLFLVRHFSIGQIDDPDLRANVKPR